jgi:hypothetical protein
MGAVSTLPAFCDAIVAALKLRAGLSGVSVFSGPVDDLSAGTEAIVFGVEMISAENTQDTMPREECWEEYDVTGWTWVSKPGAGETVIKASRDRAFAILEELVDYLTSVNGTTAATVAALGVDDARVASWKLTQFFGDGTRDCKLEYSVHVKAHYTPA